MTGRSEARGRDVPIACSLTPDAAAGRLDEWRAMFDRTVEATRRIGATRLELRLRSGADVSAVVDLARREVSCCPFFRFTLEVDVDNLTLVVEVPPEAEAVLDDFGRLVPNDGENHDRPARHH
jgi:hypothetical protein